MRKLSLASSGALTIAVLVSLGSSSLPQEAHASSVAASCSQATVTPEAFGAWGDGVHDDTKALVQALASLQPGKTLCLASGRAYEHKEVLTLSTPRVTVTGGGVLASSNPASSAFIVRGDSDVLDGVTFTSQATQRATDVPQMKLALMGTTGVVLKNLTIKGSAAAGVFISGAKDFTASNITVSKSLADGFTMTGGSGPGLVTGVHTTDTGDDGISVVSYKNEPLTHSITVKNSSVNGQSWGRGMTVVGGKDITYSDDTVSSSAGAALYVASEAPPNNTQGVTGIVLKNIDIYKANWNKNIPQGAVLFSAGNPGQPLTAIKVSNVTVHSQYAYTSRAFGQTCDASTISGITFQNSTVTQAGITPFWSNCS